MEPFFVLEGDMLWSDVGNNFKQRMACFHYVDGLDRKGTEWRPSRFYMISTLLAMIS